MEFIPHGQNQLRPSPAATVTLKYGPVVAAKLHLAASIDVTAPPPEPDASIVSVNYYAWVSYYSGQGQLPSGEEFDFVKSTQWPGFGAFTSNWAERMALVKPTGKIDFLFGNGFGSLVGHSPDEGIWKPWGHLTYEPPGGSESDWDCEMKIAPVTGTWQASDHGTEKPKLEIDMRFDVSTRGSSISPSSSPGSTSPNHKITQTLKLEWKGIKIAAA